MMMRGRYRKAIALVTGAILSALLANATQAQPLPAFQAKVLSIGDGDTLRVDRDGQLITIRLACIDAPEMDQRPWGRQSRDYLRQRLPLAQSVQVVPHTIDRYGRTVAEVIHEINLNLVMVEDGQAFAYRRYLNSCAAKEYLDAEYRASRHRFGVWQVQGGITRPWDFRHRQHKLLIPDGTTADGRRYRCGQIGSFARAQELLHQGHLYLDANGDGVACNRLPH
ncbi:MAG: thermonuclease family protein [Synechococcaceae cyanobacterium]